MLGILAVIALVLANGFFVATEFAIVAARRSRIEQLAEQGVANARTAREVVNHLDAYIAACQLGITMASLALGWIGEPAFASLVEPPLERLVGSFAPAAAHAVAVGVAFTAITALHIVIGELAPKGLAIQMPEATTLRIARPIHLFYVVFRWPITLLNAVGNGALRLFGLQPATGHEMVHSVDELRYLVTGSQRAGEIEGSEARIATRAFEFADSTAEDLMTPRTEMEAIPADISRDELLARIASGAHTRLPVYRDSLDDIVGVVHVRDVFKALARQERGLDRPEVVRPVLFVPEGKPADDLLDELRATGQQLAIVVDEYGGTAGMLTIEDLVEALVGPIKQEHESGAGGTDAHSPLEPESDGSLLLSGLTRIRDFEEITGLDLDEHNRDGVETVGGLMMASLGRIPEVGDEMHLDGRVLRVEGLDGLRVERVRLLPLEPAAREEEAKG